MEFIPESYLRVAFLNVSKTIIFFFRLPYLLRGAAAAHRSERVHVCVVRVYVWCVCVCVRTFSSRVQP